MQRGRADSAAQRAAEGSGEYPTASQVLDLRPDPAVPPPLCVHTQAAQDCAQPFTVRYHKNFYDRTAAVTNVPASAPDPLPSPPKPSTRWPAIPCPQERPPDRAWGRAVGAPEQAVAGSKAMATTSPDAVIWLNVDAYMCPWRYSLLAAIGTNVPVRTSTQPSPRLLRRRPNPAAARWRHQFGRRWCRVVVVVVVVVVIVTVIVVVVVVVVVPIVIGIGIGIVLVVLVVVVLVVLVVVVAVIVVVVVVLVVVVVVIVVAVAVVVVSGVLPCARQHLLLPPQVFFSAYDPGLSSSLQVMLTGAAAFGKTFGAAQQELCNDMSQKLYNFKWMVRRTLRPRPPPHRGRRRRRARHRPSPPPPQRALSPPASC